MARHGSLFVLCPHHSPLLLLLLLLLLPKISKWPDGVVPVRLTLNVASRAQWQTQTGMHETRRLLASDLRPATCDQGDAVFLCCSRISLTASITALFACLPASGRVAWDRRGPRCESGLAHATTARVF